MILLFSGTGNTRKVARRLAACLGEDVADLSATSSLASPPRGGLAGLLPPGPLTSSPLIWCFPCHCWGVPKVLADELKALPDHALCGTTNHLVITCGDDIGLAHRQWAQLIRRKRGRVRHIFSVQMPNTYVMMKTFDVDSPEEVDRKLAAARTRVDRIAEMIRRDDTDILDVTQGTFPWIKTRIIYPWFMRRCIDGRKFHATEACIRCGECVRQCPLGNISKDEHGLPRWGAHCTMCTRCYHICPRHAVQYAAATASKGQKPVYP